LSPEIVKHALILHYPPLTRHQFLFDAIQVSMGEGKCR